MKNIKNVICVVVFAAVLITVSLICVLKPSTEMSQSERRPLAQMPELSMQTVTDGTFMQGFESYTVDQFPNREFFRAVKAGVSEYVLQKQDNNGLFHVDGHISKLDGEISEEMLSHAAERFNNLYDKNMKDKNIPVYFSVVPDKNYYLAAQNGYPTLNYQELIDRMRAKVGQMEYIDITALLRAEDYYTTDTHWRQESITDVAEYLANAMGADVKAEYTVNKLDTPFYGVYAGQYALPTKPDEIKYLTNETLNACKVTYFNDMGKPVSGDMYNMEKATGKDPYEMYLSGTEAVVVLENPNAKEKRELILFRDSFGSSIAPLLLEGYSKITVVDIRYIQSDFVKAFADFENCDEVLFLYSTSLLNNSLAMK